jgi:hypothetical protein
MPLSLARFRVANARRVQVDRLEQLIRTHHPEYVYIDIEVL